MDWGLAFSVVEQGLKLWNTKEGRKYLDRVIELKRDWHEEFRRSDRSQMSLDKIERELQIIAAAFANSAGAGKDPE